MKIKTSPIVSGMKTVRSVSSISSLEDKSYIESLDIDSRPRSERIRKFENEYLHYKDNCVDENDHFYGWYFDGTKDLKKNLVKVQKDIQIQ